MKPQIKLGQRIKDKVTGLIGIAAGKCEYSNGWVQFLLIPLPPLDKDGNERKEKWVDDVQLEIVDNGILVESEKPTGD